MGDERIAGGAGTSASGGAVLAAVGRPRWRRWVAYGLVAVVIVAAAALVYVNSNPRRYLALMPLAGSGTVMPVAVAAPVLLGIAILLAGRSGLLTRVVAAVTLSLTLPIACLWYIYNATSWMDYKSEPPVVLAQSSDGRWEIVGITYYSDGDSDGYYEALWLRSRAGWLSRESPRPLASGWHDFGNSGPELDVVRVTFPGHNAIALFTSDGKTHDTSFNSTTLAVHDRFSLCEPDVCS